VDQIRTFAEVSRLSLRAHGRFSALVSPEWTVAGRPNGGYLLAMAARAAAAVAARPHVLAASAHYLRSPDPGPVDLEAEVLRSGQSASQVRVRMTQDGSPCVEALILAGALDPDARPYWDKGGPEPGAARYEDCPRVPARGPGGLPVAIYDQVEARMDPGSLGFAAGCPSGSGELRGWLALPGGEPFDPFSLVYAADSFPPATLEIEVSGWVPTLELTVYVRALPVPGPVEILQRVHLIDGQRADEECVVWDRTGRLVAQGRQLAAIRFGR
jgi:hypothetical protein